MFLNLRGGPWARGSGALCGEGCSCSSYTQSKDRPPGWETGVFLGAVAARSSAPAGGSQGHVGLLVLSALTLKTHTFPGSSLVAPCLVAPLLNPSGGLGSSQASSLGVTVAQEVSLTGSPQAASG